MGGRPRHAAQALVLALLCAAAADARAAPPRPAGRAVRLDPRDPEPLVTQDYLELALALQRGQLRVLSVRKGRLPAPQLLPRYRGRFEVRLYAHERLLDLLRFSFPLTGAAGERTPPNIELDRALARGVSARTTVRVPFSAQLTRAIVLDARTGRSAPVELRPWLPRPASLPVDGPKRTSVFSRP